MQNLRVKEILNLPEAGALVKVNGWIRTRRDSKDFSFLEVNDGSCIKSIQVIVNCSADGYDDVVSKITTGSSVTVEGVVKDSPGKGQRYEIDASKIFLHGIAPQDYPLQKKRHSLEFLRDIAHLRGRTNAIGSAARLRSSLGYGVHKFFQEKGFFYVNTPIITTSDCEGAGAMFRVTSFDLNNIPKTENGCVDFTKDFFGKPSSLTVSGQLEGEIYALSLGNIYTFGPTFRAENSNTPRHLAEFWMIEPEMAFYHLKDDMDLAEEFVKYLVKFILDNNGDELEFFNERIDNSVFSRLENIVKSPFERISYTDAIEILEKSKNKFEFPVSWGMDIQSEHEKYLAEKVFGKPVIVFDYPKEIKAFYMRMNDDGKTVGAMDVLVPQIGELIGGSEREERYDVLLQRIRSVGLNEEDYWWYLDLRKYGSVPHSGFGLGFERLILLVTGLQNIRDVIPFPRFPGNAKF
ncbi:MAG: asparagine--tRNA ligase [Fibrobacter sp.]|nr:asparagine--tRNA ligase [Fibrobacter sp.]